MLCSLIPCRVAYGLDLIGVAFLEAHRWEAGRVDWNRSRHGDRVEHPWVDCIRKISWPNRLWVIP